jgi:hypothetical protein
LESIFQEAEKRLIAEMHATSLIFRVFWRPIYGRTTRAQFT